MSENKPQLGDLAFDLDELAWCEITAMGDQLGMKRSALQRFDDSTPDYHKLLRAMDLWLKTDNRASWKRVVGALVAIGKDDLAQEMGKKYCRPASASQYRVDAAPHAVGAPSLRLSPPAPNLHQFAARSPETSEGMFTLQALQLCLLPLTLSTTK